MTLCQLKIEYSFKSLYIYPRILEFWGEFGLPFSCVTKECHLGTWPPICQNLDLQQKLPCFLHVHNEGQVWPHFPSSVQGMPAYPTQESSAVLPFTTKPWGGRGWIQNQDPEQWLRPLKQKLPLWRCGGGPGHSSTEKVQDGVLRTALPPRIHLPEFSPAVTCQNSHRLQNLVA